MKKSKTRSGAEKEARGGKGRNRRRPQFPKKNDFSKTGRRGINEDKGLQKSPLGGGRTSGRKRNEAERDMTDYHDAGTKVRQNLLGSERSLDRC